MQRFRRHGKIAGGGLDGLVEGAGALIQQRRQVVAGFRQLVARGNEDFFGPLDVVGQRILDFGGGDGQIHAGALGQLLKLAITLGDQGLELLVLIAQHQSGRFEDLGDAAGAFREHGRNGVA